MRAVVLRLSRIIVVALGALLALSWARQRDVEWAGWGVAAALFTSMLVLDFARRRRLARAARERRWETALSRPHERPRAIEELRSALGQARDEAERARLSVLLAELLDADGQCRAAAELVDALPLDALPALDAALVRHTRAVTHLRASDPEGALSALVARAPSGDDELDQRLSLLATYARVELGEAEAGLTEAAAMESRKGVDVSVVLEARVVRAAALDALGRREEALVTLAALGRDALQPLSELGQPRVRALAQVVLEGLTD